MQSILLNSYLSFLILCKERQVAVIYSIPPLKQQLLLFVYLNMKYRETMLSFSSHQTDLGILRNLVKGRFNLWNSFI